MKRIDEKGEPVGSKEEKRLVIMMNEEVKEARVDVPRDSMPEMEERYETFLKTEFAHGPIGHPEYRKAVNAYVDCFCSCGAIRHRSGYSNWSPEIAEKIKTFKDEHDKAEKAGVGRGANLAIARMNNVIYDAGGSLYGDPSSRWQGRHPRFNEISEEEAPHHPKCRGHGFYSSVRIAEPGMKEVTGVTFILDSPDGHSIRIRRYDRRVEWDGVNEMEVWTQPKGQFFFTESGKIEDVIQSRKTKKGLSYSRPRNPENTISSMGKTNLDALSKKGAVEFNVDETATKAAAWSRTGLKEFMDNLKSTSNHYKISSLLEFLLYRNEHPSVEQLLKAGFVRYATEAVQLGKEVAGSVSEEIPLPRPIQKHIKYLSHSTIDGLKKVHEKSPLTDDFVRIVSQDRNQRHFRNLLELITDYGYSCRDIAAYTDRVWASQAIDFEELMVLWPDTMRLAKQLERKIERFPKSLKQDHDVLSRDYTLVADELMNREYLEKRKNDIAEKYRMESKDFLIREPASLAEINDEGQFLNHCVASYGKNVARGLTTILFLRRKDHADEPFLTIEVVNGRMTQCRGKYNKWYANYQDEGLNSFIEEWKRKKGLERD